MSKNNERKTDFLIIIFLSILLITSIWLNLKLLNKKPEIIYIPYNPYHIETIKEIPINKNLLTL